MTFQSITAGSGADIRVNDNFDAVANAGCYGRKNPTTTGLTWGYYGGQFAGNTIADGTVSLTASSTNYIVALISTGVVSSATTTTNWVNALYLQIAQVVTGASTITSWKDYRPTLSTGGSGGGFSNPMTTVGDMIVGGTAGAATRVAAGTATYIWTANGAGVAPSWQASGGGGGVSLSAVNVFTKNQSVTPSTLTSGGTIALDASLSNNFKLTLGTNATLSNPTNATNGMVVNLRIKQDATGSRTLAYGSAYKWPGGTAGVVSTAANAVDLLSMYYDSTDAVWACVLQKGFA